MRNRSMALLIAAAASLAPAGAMAGNPDDCHSPILMRSGQGLIVSGNAVNCDGLQASEVTYSPVFPGGAADILLEGVVAPVNGDRRTGTGSYLTYTSTSLTGSTSLTKVYLTWEQGEGLTGPIPGAWGSQPISFSPRDSVVAGDIRVVVYDGGILDPETGAPVVYERIFKTATGWVDGV